MESRSAFIPLSLFLSALLLLPAASAESTCELDDCKITITIKMAFSYNESEISQNMVNSWVQDIESVWNGPDGFRTTGDCSCEVRYEAESMKITDPSQANCNPGPAGYHCIMVTDYEKNPPRNQTEMQGAEFYRGYMYNPSQGGASENGWWSDLMDEPHPDTGETVHDAAHEAGHMMGLDDEEGDGLMTHTWGDRAEPTQDNIDQTVENVCGADACPDRCCCGNGQVDQGKEDCDPFASPNGCPSGEACCPVCCSCYAPQCSPGSGEYVSQEACEIGCKGGFGCYLNYRTGCWDCLRQSVVAESLVYDPEQAPEQGKAFHQAHLGLQGAGLDIPENMLEMVRQLYNQNINTMPQVRDLLANDRINFYIEDLGCAGIVNVDGYMESIQSGCLDDPTLNMRTDMATLNSIIMGSLSPSDALREGRITMEGVGIFNWLRFSFSGFLFGIASAMGLA